MKETAVLRSFHLPQRVATPLYAAAQTASYRLDSKCMHGDEHPGNSRGTHGNSAGMETIMLRGCPGDGNKCHGTHAGMEQNCAGFSLECSSV